MYQAVGVSIKLVGEKIKLGKREGDGKRGREKVKKKKREKAREKLSREGKRDGYEEKRKGNKGGNKRKRGGKYDFLPH